MDKIILALILIIIVLFFVNIKLWKVKRTIGWGKFFTEEEKKYFFQLVHAYFIIKKIEATITEGIVYIEGTSLKLGLNNIAQICHQSARNEWTGLVAEHFDRLLETMQSEAEFEETAKDYAKVSRYLGVRLYSKKYVENANQVTKMNMIFREDIADTVTALVYDMPSTVRTVNLHDAQLWGKDMNELFAVGLENVKKNCIPEITQENLTDDIKVTLLRGDSMFITSLVFFLDDFPTCTGEYGALIGLPHRHALLCYPVEDLAVIDALKALIAMISGMYKEGPGSISPNLYWNTNGKFINLPYKQNEKQVEFFPPDEFTELLNKLGSDPALPFLEWRLKS